MKELQILNASATRLESASKCPPVFIAKRCA